MKNFITIIGLLLAFYSGFSQNYQCVYPDKKAYFEESTNKRVRCIRIDSSFNNGAVMYPFSEVHSISQFCYKTDLGSWIGKKIVIDHEGNTIFYNGINKPVFINNKAAVNIPWTVYKDEEFIILGEVTEHGIDSFLGLQDSVKTITFKVLDLDSLPTSHKIDNMQIKISESYGLVSTINFFNFPKVFYSYDNGRMFGEIEPQVLQLIGLSNPEIGFKNITKREEIYDFQPGDELHIHTYSYSMPNPSTESKKIIKYKSRTDFNDRIEYKVEITTNFSDNVSIEKETIMKYTLFQHESLEPKFNRSVSMNIVYNGLFPSINENGTQVLNPSHLTDTCFMEGTLYFFGNKFIKGLGGPYYHNIMFFGFDESYRSLEYYKKGDIEVGTPLKLPVSVNEIAESNKKLTIYPNPAKDNISIKDVEFENIIIYDMTGREVINIDYYQPNINISDLNSGTYFVVAKSGNTILKNKMIKL